MSKLPVRFEQLPVIRLLFGAAIAFATLLIFQLIFPGVLVFFSEKSLAGILPRLQFDYDFLVAHAGAEFAITYVNVFFVFFLLFAFFVCLFVVYGFRGIPIPPRSARQNKSIIKSLLAGLVLVPLCLAWQIYFPTPFYAAGRSLAFSVPLNRFAFVFPAILNFGSLFFLVIATLIAVQLLRAGRNKSA